MSTKESSAPSKMALAKAAVSLIKKGADFVNTEMKLEDDTKSSRKTDSEAIDKLRGVVKRLEQSLKDVRSTNQELLKRIEQLEHLQKRSK